MNIYIVENDNRFTPEQVKKLKKFGPVSITEKQKVDITKELLFKDRNEKVLAIAPGPVGWQLPFSVIKRIPNLKAICLPTTGFDWVDGKSCRNLGITVTNVPHYSTDSVAEYAIFLMFCLVRRLPLQIKDNYIQSYAERMVGEEVRGKTAGIIGLGDIGKRIAELCKGLGMNVIYWSRNKKKARFKYKKLEDVASGSDFLFPALVLNNETENFLSKKLLSRLKKSAYFTSITHEEGNKRVYDRNFLIKQVNIKRLAGLAFESSRENVDDFKGNIMAILDMRGIQRKPFETILKFGLKPYLHYVAVNQ